MEGSLKLAPFYACWMEMDLKKESDILPKKKKSLRRRKKGTKTLMPLKKKTRKKSHILCLWTKSIGVLPTSNNSVT